MGLTDRELASVILLALFVGAIFAVPKIRVAVLPSLIEVAKAFVNSKILTVILSYFAYAALIVAAGERLGVWGFSLLKDTIIIALFVGLPLVFNASEVRDGHLLVGKVVKETIGISALMAFYFGLESLPLWGELLLQPFLGLFAMMALVASHEEATKNVAKFCNTVNALVGLALLFFTTVQIARHWSTYDLQHEVASLALSIWLPVLLIPFIYVLGFLMQCETILITLPFCNDKKQPKLRARLALLVGMHLNTRYSSALTGNWRRPIASAQTYREGREVMKAFRNSARDKAEAEKQRLAHLRIYAGVDGTDEQGLRLDRREFGPTKKVLTNLYDMQMGWHRNRLGHYRDDILSILGDVSKDGLLSDHCIELKVSKTKQSWMAWRRTVGGWYFGVGGTKEPNDEWHYDGVKPPSNFPGDSRPEWVNVTRESSPLEWAKNDDPIR